MHNFVNVEMYSTLVLFLFRCYIIASFGEKKSIGITQVLQVSRYFERYSIAVGANQILEEITFVVKLRHRYIEPFI